ncbi:MAG TPA: hypothetical protein VFQ25_08135, partial [Ktedonobacterales bacterium]|nr:hypothetical protein [Ktedonobacterales bacterium]
MIDAPQPAMSEISAPHSSGYIRPFHASVCGSLVRVTGLSPSMRVRLSALLRPFLAPPGEHLAGNGADIAIHLEPSPADRSWRIFINGMFLTQAPDSLHLIPQIEWLVISRAVERSHSDAVFHAASLAWKRRAVILVAPSGSGKTTLTAGLASRGWKPLTDDLTVVDRATRAISPFRRCFHADAFTRSTLEAAIPMRAPIATLADYIRPTHWAPARCEPAWVVIVRRDPAEPASIAPVTRAQAAGALFTSAIRNGLTRSEVAQLSAGLASTISGCWELNNSDLSET